MRHQLKWRSILFVNQLNGEMSISKRSMELTVLPQRRLLSSELRHRAGAKSPTTR